MVLPRMSAICAGKKQRKIAEGTPLKIRLFPLVFHKISGPLQLLAVAFHYLSGCVHLDRTQIPLFLPGYLFEYLVKDSDPAHRLSHLSVIPNVAFPASVPVFQRMPCTVLRQGDQASLPGSDIIVNLDQTGLPDLSQDLSLKFQAFHRAPVFLQTHCPLAGPADPPAAALADAVHSQVIPGQSLHIFLVHIHPSKRPFCRYF